MHFFPIINHESNREGQSQEQPHNEVGQPPSSIADVLDRAVQNEKNQTDSENGR